MVGALSSESNPRPEPISAKRWVALVVGLALVAGYLLAPELPISFNRVEEAVGKVQFRFAN